MEENMYNVDITNANQKIFLTGNSATAMELAFANSSRTYPERII